jgi:hypothetical protein
MRHKTGFHCWLYGMCYWHRTLEGAQKRAAAAQWCSDAQVIEVATGRRV